MKMEESNSRDLREDQERYILKFAAATGFTVVLEFGGMEELEEYKKRIEDAGLQCTLLPKFNVKFDQADLFMDLRSPVCVAQFDLDDWI